MLARIFARQLTDPAQCPNDFDGVEDNRKRGDIVPRVLSAAHGAFTTSGATQRLYVISVGECDASWPSELAVVLQRSMVVARVALLPSTSIGGLFDLDGDGRLEVLFLDGFTNMGSTVVSASLVHINPAGLGIVKDFGQVSQGNCGSLEDARKEKSLLIRAFLRSGAAPHFLAEQVLRPCK